MDWKDHATPAEIRRVEQIEMLRMPLMRESSELARERKAIINRVSNRARYRLKSSLAMKRINEGLNGTAE